MVTLIYIIGFFAIAAVVAVLALKQSDRDSKQL
jgi:hypothetical protein